MIEFQGSGICFKPRTNVHTVSLGEATAVTTLDSSFHDFTHRWVRFLPDGDHFIFFVRTGGGGGEVFVALSAVLGYMTLFPTVAPVNKIYSRLHLPEDNRMTGYGGGSLSLSPDGLKIAFVAKDTATGDNMLWVRALSSQVALQLPGTKGAYSPFWSHDNRYVAVFSRSDNKLKKILASGGTALCTRFI